MVIAAAPDAELRELIHRHGLAQSPAAPAAAAASERPRGRRSSLRLPGPKIPVQPAVRRAFQAGRAGFHVVLGVEMRARRVW